MKRLMLFLLAAIACAAPVGAQDATPAPHGSALSNDQYLVLIQAATTGMSAYGSDRTGCGTDIPVQPDVCARQIVKFADALVVATRASENWH